MAGKERLRLQDAGKYYIYAALGPYKSGSGSRTQENIIHMQLSCRIKAAPAPGHREILYICSSQAGKKRLRLRSARFCHRLNSRNFFLFQNSTFHKRGDIWIRIHAFFFSFKELDHEIGIFIFFLILIIHFLII